MVYPLQLGWKPFMECYMRNLPDSIDKENKKLIRDMFEWLVDPCLCECIMPHLYITVQYVASSTTTCLLLLCVY